MRWLRAAGREVRLFLCHCVGNKVVETLPVRTFRVASADVVVRGVLLMAVVAAVVVVVVVVRALGSRLVTGKGHRPRC